MVARRLLFIDAVSVFPMFSYYVFDAFLSVYDLLMKLSPERGFAICNHKLVNFCTL